MPSIFTEPSPDQRDWNAYVEDFRRAGHETIDWICQFLSETRNYPVVPDMRPGELVDALPKSAPDKGEPFNMILADFRGTVLPAVTQWNHPAFLAYFGTTGSTPAILGEMISAALNTNGLHWKTSPAVAELEQVTLGWLRQWLGLPDDFFGIIYDTASVSTMHAIAAAREFADPGARENGARSELVMYTSNQSHSSVEKGAIAVGIGHKNVRLLPVDSEFRVRADVLAKMVEEDVAAGKKPFCVVATVGTTSSTSIDPVPQMADIAERHGMWLHVDAAYAGTAAIVPEYRHILAGVERAHSLVINPHKWLLTPIDLSTFYTRRPDILRRAFSLVPEYLRASEAPRAVNLMDYGVPLGHRFRSLKLWFTLRYFGREGVESIVRAHIEMAREFAAWVKADDRFEVVAPVPLSVVCFRYRGSDDENKAILERVNASGKTYISHTSLNGKYVLRVAIGNLGTTRADIKLAWELVKEAAG